MRGGQFIAPGGRSARAGATQRLRIAASDVSLAREQPSQSTIANVLRARILEAREHDDHSITAILGLGEDGAGERLLSRVTRRSWRMLELAPGQPVWAQVKGVALLRSRAP